MDNHGCGSTDAEIARRIVAGDVDAFKEVLKKYQRHVLNIIKKHVPYGQVEDVAQDTFIRVFQSLTSATFGAQNSFEGWVSTIAIRTCYDFWRKQYRAREFSMSSLTDGQQAWLEGALSEASAQSFQQKATEKEAKEILDWALNRLSAEDRMVVELVHLEGFSAKEAGRLLGWTAANVKVRSFSLAEKTPPLAGAGIEGWEEKEMKSHEKKVERLLDILRGAYLEKEKLEAGNRWQGNVMHRIRNLRNIEVAPDPSMGFLQFTWKLAPVTVLLVLALTAFLIGSGLISGYGVFEFGLGGPEGLILSEMVIP